MCVCVCVCVCVVNIITPHLHHPPSPHSLSLELHRLLRSVVLEPEQGSPRIRLLASAILRELSPSSSIVVKDFNPPVEKANIPYVLPVLLAQTNARERLSQLAPDIIKSVANFPFLTKKPWTTQDPDAAGVRGGRLSGQLCLPPRPLLPWPCTGETDRRWPPLA